jgi:uncharacterized protein
MRARLKSLGSLLGALFVTAGVAQAAAPGPLEGDWIGQIDAGAVKLRLALHVHTRDGVETATFDSPDQGAMGLPAKVMLQGREVRISVQGAAGAFAGNLAESGAELAGTWSGAPTRLTRLAAGASPPAGPKRPQTPHPPYPYVEVEARFPSADGKAELAGVLTLPAGQGPFPAVALISGSGPQTRNEEIFGHQIFAVLADALTRRGIAVLRWDKRGLGQSTGDYKDATSADFAEDAEGAARWLRARSEIDARRVGLLGHSEGGLIAPMVAGRDPKIAFVVLLAGPGLPGDQIIREQGRLIAAAMGVPPASLDVQEALQKRLIAAVTAASDTASAEAAARDILRQTPMPPAQIEAQARAVASPWFRWFLTYDPAPALRRMTIPTLALIGEKDLQVPPDRNLPALKAALAGDPQAVVEAVPGVNHLFQTARTGTPIEYARIEETMAPAVLARVGDWILQAAAVR